MIFPWELQELFYSRSVSIIGGADHVDLNTANSSDLVIRINNHFLHQGGKVDAIYSAACAPPAIPYSRLRYIAFDLNGPFKDELQQLCSQHKIRNYGYPGNGYTKPNPIGPEHEWLNTFTSELGTKPFTGILAIKHISIMPVKSIFLTGFDFYSSGGCETRKTLSGEKVIVRGPHAIAPQLAWFYRLLMHDRRITTDDRIKESFAEATGCD